MFREITEMEYFYNRKNHVDDSFNNDLITLFENFIDKIFKYIIRDYHNNLAHYSIIYRLDDSSKNYDRLYLTLLKDDFYLIYFKKKCYLCDQIDGLIDLIKFYV